MARGRNKKVSVSNMKRAAHHGRAPVKGARIAPPGIASVPVSVATLPPGQGPPMSSTPASRERGTNRRPRNSRAKVSIVKKIQNAASSPSGRKRRKR